jgi:PAS domain S-box-containing protein
VTRILIVDDKEENLYYLNALLGARGCTVESARHGAEALVKARKTPPDLIISDLLMPVMDGYTLLRHWKADSNLKRVPFVVYTATYTEAEDEELALNLGADAFILKPTEPEVFVARLEQVQASVTAAVPKLPQHPQDEEKELLQEYSEILIRKLEQKTLELEETNRSLEKDIAARELVEGALRESEAKFREAERQASERAAVLDALFESVPDVVIHVDPDGKIRLTNRGFPGVPREAMTGSSWLSWVPSEQREQMTHAFETVMSTGKPTSFEASLPAFDGAPAAYWYTIAPVLRDGKITGAVVVARDITARKQSEAQLIVSDRMASVGTLAAGVAHEINNPLASVTANLSLVSQQLESLTQLYPIPSDVLDAIQDSREGAERVRLIVRDLKIFSRGEEAKHGPINVEQVLESTLRMAWNEVRHRAQLTRIYGKVPPVAGNEARLGQVFLNLVINAAQAIPEGNYALNEVRVETQLDAANRAVVVSISDTGTGIPVEVQGRLFTPFVTTKPVGVGTGLGLSICQRIISSLGGHITFESTPGRGTTFRVSLPMAERSPPPPEAQPENAAKPTRRGAVLVIDDEVMIGQFVTRLLSTEHDVRVVDCAEDALGLFRAGQRFDVVLCDLMMPQVTGMDLYAVLCELDRQQAERIVFMTGGAFTPSARAFLNSVPNPRLEKPFEVQELRALVNRLVH